MKLTNRGKVVIGVFVIALLLAINYFITPAECRTVEQPLSKKCEQLLKES